MYTDIRIATGERMKHFIILENDQDLNVACYCFNADMTEGIERIPT